MKTVLLGLGLALLSVGAAQAIDCGKAATDLENAICGTPDLLAADAAMSTAYAAALKAVGPKMAKLLKADQIDWNQYRYDNCTEGGDPGIGAAEIARCLLEDTRRRTAFLAGQPLEGPGLPEAALPQVLAGADGVFNEYVRFDTPLSPITRAFDKLLEQELADVNMAKSDDHVSDYYQLVLHYASPTLLSVEVDREYEEGYAHPMTYAYSINLDATGRRLTISDAFGDAAVRQLEQVCEAQLRDFIATGEEGAEQRRGQVDSIVDDLDFWTFGADRASTRFVEYGMDGPVSCELGYDVLRPLIKSTFPLPG